MAINVDSDRPTLCSGQLLTPSKHNLHGRGNSFCKSFGRQFFSFLQKQQTLVSLNKRFGRHGYKSKLGLLAKRYLQPADRKIKINFRHKTSFRHH